MKKHRAAWLGEAKFGVFCHYLAATAYQMRSLNVALPSPEEWSRRVDAVDVESLASSIAGTGARYFFITIGQKTGHYCSPNRTYAEMTGIDDGSLSRRDLVADLVAAFRPHGVKVMVYISSLPTERDAGVLEALGCTPNWDASKCGIKPGTYRVVPGTDDRLTTFQRNWEAIIREWSERWGSGVHGWWVDGCYYADRMYEHDDDGPGFRTFADAMRAGNPDAIVSFNSGVMPNYLKVQPITPYEDYTAGEVSRALPVAPVEPVVDGAQYHILGYLGEWWRIGEPRLDDALAIAYTRHITDRGGAVTWDVPIDHFGVIPDDFIRQLTAIGKAC